MTLADYREARRADRLANAHNSKGRLIVSAYRFTAFLHANRARNVAARIAAAIVHAAYRGVVDYTMGVYLPVEARIGKGLCVWHGVGLVVHPDCVIGDSCTLRHGVTIGSRDGSAAAVPVIGAHVVFGANAVVIGRVTLGDHVVVGAGAVVLCDVPAGSLVVGNPAIARPAQARPS
ncbi:DapH/DapD/GlmU-related protein [Novosphingobium sp.]|uniref:DapH/DapD/GlmU-related protein n=1 Tax=Novosphingobium sp. TaxID=1874826 RepID=UPI003D12BDD2